ncbi:MAG: PD-(D/E)XK nuclease family protein [Ruminiclostridium sp.]|nr:PD-(D/E)XK nuclease family protein [Ruminiclostridium sp.]
MLKLICGEAGTGKSCELRERLSSTVDRGGTALLIVPDQFSFEAEKLVFQKLKAPYKGKYRVTTFSKEAQLILKKHGRSKPYADDVAKDIVMKLALENARSDGALMYYNKQIGMKSFPRFALGMVGDMRGAGISPADLRKKIETNDTLGATLTKKLNDISVIYTEYDRLLSQNFKDRLDDVRSAAELIAQTDGYKDCTVYIDEFDGFSGSQMMFIQRLIDNTAEVDLALTCDYPDMKERRYAAVNELIGQLSITAKPEYLRLTEQHRAHSQLRVTEARDKWQECEWICSEICELTDSGARYRDIAVICPDTGTARILDSTMKRYGINGFSDIPEPLITKWFVRFPIYTLRALSFETGDILRYVKSGFVRDTNGVIMNGLNSKSSAADELEQLSRKYDLRRKDWLKPFPSTANGQFDKMEELRRSIIDPLVKLAESMGIRNADSKADGAVMIKLLCEFMCSEMHITSAVKSRCITGKADSGRFRYDNKLLDELSEIWDDMITVFESAYKALHGHAMTVAELIDILTDAFTGVKISKPPQTLDAVTIGDPERSRFTDVKHLFICGFNRGVMPPPPRISDVFTPAESEKLSELKIPVTSSRAERCAAELFTVYRCQNIPSERLYITYHVMDEDGSFTEPSDALKDIAGYDRNNIQGADNFGAEFYCRSESSSERYLSSIYQNYERRAERRMLMDSRNSLISPLFRSIMYSASGDRPDRERHKLPGELAGKLLTMPSYSPSAITTMNKCKFMYFCQYGLGLPQEDETRSINNILTGNVIHHCLRELFDRYPYRNRNDFLALTPEQIDAHIADSIKSYEDTYYFGDFGGEARFSYLLKRLGIYASMSAKKAQDEMKTQKKYMTENKLPESYFYPSALESPIALTFDGITIKGTCDRIDTAAADGKTYVRVIDYKRSPRDFPLSDLYKGNNLQSLLYLYSICGNSPDLIPASALYVPVGGLEFNASDNASAVTNEELIRKYYCSHRPSGFVVTGTPAKAEKDTLNDEFSKEYGTIRNSAYFTTQEISPDVYNCIHVYINEYLKNMIQETGRGIAGACPKNGACMYCGYKLFCGGAQEEK